jgi:hypothetical protein
VECIILRGEPQSSSSSVPRFEDQVMTFHVNTLSQPAHAPSFTLSTDSIAATAQISPRLAHDARLLRSLGSLPSRPAPHGNPRQRGESSRSASDDDVDEWAEAAVRKHGLSFYLDGQGDPTVLRTFGGILTEINGLNSSSIPHTKRNAELFHFCEPYLYT